MAHQLAFVCFLRGLNRYRKERDREAERAEESRRLLAAEEARKQVR